MVEENGPHLAEGTVPSIAIMKHWCHVEIARKSHFYNRV